jgi:2-keto-4-pentenoate hydratase/2-oxohepta-3-ene-1,7-dioic acid hydratase in catechol pathway
MKIVGFSNIDNHVKMVLKSDSSLMVNRKPFFIPDWSEEMRYTPCVVVRVCKLGKHIAPKFASRYYDSIAPAINIYADDFRLLGDATRAWAFDGSLPVGSFVSLERYMPKDLIVTIDDAICEVSRLMTIRQGDLIFIDRAVPSRELVREEVLLEEIEGEEVLYCKIK